MKSKKRIKLKFGDFVMFAVFIVAIITFFCFTIKPNAKGKNQLVIENGNDEWIFQLDKNQCVEIDGKLGKSVIRIEGGKAFFESSPCENKLCVSASKISKKGEWNACLPNSVIIRIAGDAQDGDIDAMTN